MTWKASDNQTWTGSPATNRTYAENLNGKNDTATGTMTYEENFAH